MSQFRTVVNIPKSINKPDYKKSILFTGSCFSENIGKKLQDAKFKVDINPFGILYNPSSIKNSYEILLYQKYFCRNDLFFYNSVWNSFYHHSRFSHIDPEVCLEQINNRIIQGYQTLANASFVFITFGTAWVYESIEKEFIVSNCHKLPASKFRRYLLDENIIMDDYRELFNKLRSVNPSLQVVLTVSPIRHWKDGAINNQVSKSILLLAISRLIKEFDYVNYFPAYEIMMDDLRDYRFYDEDMLHPNSSAVEYIWQRFCETYLDKKTMEIIGECEKIYKAMQHKPFNINTTAFLDFNKNMIKKIQDMQVKYPFLDLVKEKEYFENKLNKK
ncbi:MAG: GSCFA domain-containing protein [Bacteroidales bacterium]|nr:GSCFA domain-containing protein [Bacteroidales bacterium]